MVEEENIWRELLSWADKDENLIYPRLTMRIIGNLSVHEGVEMSKKPGIKTLLRSFLHARDETIVLEAVRTQATLAYARNFHSIIPTLVIFLTFY